MIENQNKYITQQESIESLWQQGNIAALNSQEHQNAAALINDALSLLDQGEIFVTYKQNDQWHVNSWVKKAILLSFKFLPMRSLHGGCTSWYDKMPMKFTPEDEQKIIASGIRSVPGGYIRYGSYIEPSAVLMPSFVNIGAHIGAGTMIDTWATIGSCAYIGKNCHISGGTGIGGVLEPIQANPVIIEDNCFIGARSEIAEGVIIGEGAVISMGVFLGASTKIVNRQTGEISYGYIPPYSVVVPGFLPSGKDNIPGLACAVIVKQVDAQTRSKISINELLR
jgi:2,3,4,5-tetrahydropyridine-2-carboxylate N-succinyltransferase